MEQKAINYGIVLYQLGVTQDAVENMRSLLKGTPQLYEALKSPVVSHVEKRNVAGRVFGSFGDNACNFMKTLCDNDYFGNIYDIFDAYETCRCDMENVITAYLYYVTPPTDEQKKGIEAFLSREFGGRSVKLLMEEKKDLIGGFVINCQGREYDRSVLGRYKALRQKLVMR